MSGQLPPLSLYIHIPWCERKCPYCDFNSHRSEGALPEAAYVHALLTDLDAQLDSVQGREILSIFIGGGTPSLFSGDSMARILEGVSQRLQLAPDCEITLEANPGSAEADKFKAFAAAGVNRLSLGIQSFNDLSLQALGRVHDSREARAAVEMAQEAGFSSVNLDLMHGLPGQGVDDACADLDTAIAFGTEHLSWYQLTIERNTAFYSQPPTLPLEDALAEIQDEGEARLAAASFENYEVSAFARNGQVCRHNINYWEFGDYLGIGAGAHGKLTGAGGVWRTARRRQPDDYLQRPSGKREQLSPAILRGDFMLNALRLSAGFDPALFPQRTGLPLANVDPILQSLAARKLLRVEPQRIQATPLGRRFLDAVIGEFL